MVLDYYKLREQPFGVTPDPRYSYMGATHREALASLTYGLSSNRGFVALVAKPGMGKTTLLFQLLRQLDKVAKTVFLFQTVSSPKDFLRSLLADLGVESNGDPVQMHQELNQIFLRESRARRQVIIAIDEAQNLGNDVLETVRMLSNFETARSKLVQIVLAGQPQLADKLADPQMVQLRQRISILTRLVRFKTEETSNYIDHRLRVAGYSFENPLFTKQAIELIAEHSEGIPRNINNICFNSLSLGFVLKQKTIDQDIILETLADAELAWSEDFEPNRSAILESSADTPAIELPPAVPVSEPVRSIEETPAEKAVPLPVVARVEESARSITTEISSEPPSVQMQPAILAAAAEPDAPVNLEPSVEAVPVSEPVSRPRSRFMKFGVVAAGLVLLTGTLPLPTAAKMEPSVEIPQKLQTTPVASSVAASIPANANHAVQERFHWITVAPNQTFYQICINNYGRYDEEILEAIFAANPSLEDPDLIVSGERLRLPSRIGSAIVEKREVEFTLSSEIGGRP